MAVGPAARDVVVGEGDVEVRKAAALFAGVAALACWAPTRAVMRVDPVVSLRTE